MLRLKDIKKYYKVADQQVAALKGLNLSFRKSEFVSILGPSGCGKTTTLNIIGGLDKYTSGDLFINGRSTKEFNDRDWDVYRNHRIGFIFQSYNLIPHQTILGNVELALTIAGIGKAERIERSKKALDKVGLSGQYNKKPNQLSGGQCQRVAIARALVNNPEILLADEPTGALDTQTSIQIMELIKEISKEKLVIMVTHNPELAEKYSTRIVKLLDGELVSDSNPFSEEDEIKEIEAVREFEINDFKLVTESLSESEIKKYKKNNKENAKMSLWTAFKLSAKNLHSKLKRTIMVALAGCIGIVGVSTVLAVSTGVRGYINDMQNDMLSGNPITVAESGIDYTSLMDQSTFAQEVGAVVNGDFVNVNSMIEYLCTHSDALNSLMYNNNITDKYVKYVKDMPHEYYSAIALDYGIDVTNNIYTNFTVDKTNERTKSMSVQAIKSMYTSLLGETSYKDYASVVTSLTDVFAQSINESSYIESQYDYVTGRVATEKNEIMIVLGENQTLTDLLLAQLGYYSQEEFFNLIYKATLDPKYDESLYKKEFNYDELLGKTFTWYPNNEVYSLNPLGNKDFSPFIYNAYEDSTLTDGLELEVVGILKPKSGVSYGTLSSGFFYTEELTSYIIKSNIDSEIVTYLENNNMNSFSGIVQDGNYIGGITYQFTYDFKRDDAQEYSTYNSTAYIGSINQMSQMMALMGYSDGTEAYSLTSRMLGGSDIPASINIYPVDFTIKDKVTSYLDKWNTNEDITLSDGTVLLYMDSQGNVLRSQIKYTDQIALIINMITNMIDIITYALVAFTALSLVVSTVMVGIITYVSVVERIKEIGVIRSLGGRKKDVSHLFNAETFIIGLSSGVLGIIITAIISFVLNIIIKNLTGINTIADLTFPVAMIMIALSVVLTLISGLIPARSAAHKDPVDALRTE